MATMMESTTKTIKEHAGPALEVLEENVRDVRRAVVAGRHTVEDCAAETTLQVRRHPSWPLALRSASAVSSAAWSASPSADVAVRLRRSRTPR